MTSTKYKKNLWISISTSKINLSLSGSIKENMLPILDNLPPTIISLPGYIKHQQKRKFNCLPIIKPNKIHGRNKRIIRTILYISDEMKNIRQVNTKLINQQPHHLPNQSHLKAEPFLPYFFTCYNVTLQEKLASTF